ncbi:MAG: rhomboid family intramembrane serine protease [Planctomycetes bacterium]|jgi:membrane associated rhomboid family serine protease|nr:rhomboid family intramembrane serine protease [Planctomycetota bacterium]MCL4729106.1 rhomboid family intramembrane serine protease [Planctomycetota bacterium]
MFPLKTTERLNSWPVVTWLLIALNIYVFVQQLSVADPVHFIMHWGLVPARHPYLFHPGQADVTAGWQTYAPLVTSMFLHGGLWHLLGNMLSLWVFGPNVEDRFGHVGFAVIYLACGLAAAITQLAFSTGEALQIPVVGASGAIAGIMGGFFVLFPKARVVSVVPIWIVPLIVRVPAFVFLFFWIGMNVINALTELQLSFNGTQSAGVAWWAHIGGFVIGAVYGLVLARRAPKEAPGEG